MKNFLILMLGFSSPVFAIDWSSQGGAQAYVGAQVGISVPSESNTSARLGYGAKAGAKLGDNFGVGGYFLGSNKNENTSVYGSFNYNIYGIEADYYFDGSGAGGYFGVDVGLSKISTTDNSGNSFSYSPFVFGVQGGYDYMITTFFSLGIEASVLFVGGGNASSGNISNHLSGFTALNFLGQAKFWF